MTLLEWFRLLNGVLFIVVAGLFGAVNWLRRRETEPWDAMARVGSEALFLCLAYAAAEAYIQGVPTGPRLLPVTACLLLITVAYVALLAKEIRKRKESSDAAQ